MTSKIAEHPFRFVGCWELREPLGQSPRDEQQLLEAIEEIPLDSIYYHTHRFFLRHKYIAGPYPNDFATWAAIQVRDQVLGEKLGVPDPFESDNLEELRAEIVSILEDHLSQLPIMPRVTDGEPFHFMQSHIIEIPTGLQAFTLTQFRENLAMVDAGSIYYHTFEATIRLRRKRNDYVRWIEEQLSLPELAQRISQIDPYMTNLEGLRHRILQLCDKELEQRTQG